MGGRWGPGAGWWGGGDVGLRTSRLPDGAGVSCPRASRHPPTESRRNPCRLTRGDPHAVHRDGPTWPSPARWRRRRTSPPPLSHRQRNLRRRFLSGPALGLVGFMNWRVLIWWKSGRANHNRWMRAFGLGFFGGRRRMVPTRTNMMDGH